VILTFLFFIIIFRTPNAFQVLFSNNTENITYFTVSKISSALDSLKSSFSLSLTLIYASHLFIVWRTTELLNCHPLLLNSNYK